MNSNPTLSSSGSRGPKPATKEGLSAPTNGPLNAAMPHNPTKAGRSNRPSAHRRQCEAVALAEPVAARFGQSAAAVPVEVPVEAVPQAGEPVPALERPQAAAAPFR